MDNWISVDDKPEKYKRVLIFEPACDPKYPESYIMAVSHWNGAQCKKSLDYEWPDGQDEQPSGYSPTHWMPLPKPPIE